MSAAVFGDVTSANIVGYQNVSQSESGRWLRGATFNTTGAAQDVYDIQSLVPSIPEESYDDEGEPLVLEDTAAQMQLINVFGKPIKTYFYMTKGGSAKMDAAGWYEDNNKGGYDLVTKNFNRGEGFRYISPVAYSEGGEEEGEELATSLLTAGEVKMESKTYTLSESGRWQLSNYRPVELDIQKLVPSIPAESYDDEGEPLVLEDTAAQIQLINVFGKPTKTYFYMTKGGSAKMDVAGWYEDNNKGGYDLVTKNFAPGEGFLYISPVAYSEGGEEEGEEIETFLTFQD